MCGAEVDDVPVAGDHHEPLVVDDLRISDKRYGLTLPLVRCGSCGFTFAAGTSAAELAALYGELDDVEYGASAAGRRKQMAHLLRWVVAGSAERGRLLDVGAASGVLVEEASASGFDAVGVEPSRPLAQRARDAGQQVLTGTLPHPELDGQEFDVVTLVDVIEHVDAPIDLLERCRAQLRAGGRLVVVTPDSRSVAARVLGRRWWHRRLAHVGYFDRSTLTRALGEAGFAPERWARPRWYFPVGYLVARVLQYVPGARGRADAVPTSTLLVPLNLRDSLAVVARAA